MNNSLVLSEIMEQPEVMRRLLQDERSRIEQVAQRIGERPPRLVVLAARGSSDNAARYGQYVFGITNRLPVALATPSLFTLYKQAPRLDEALVLGISQSGQSPDIVAVVEEGRRQGAPTVAISNDPRSALAAAAEHTICLHAGLEQSIAATKTYTASLLALAMMSAALTQDIKSFQALENLPDMVAEVLDSAPATIQAAQPFRDSEACVVVSRGYNYATAFEIALKIKELTYTLAEPYSSADFQHGPLALIERGFPVLAIVPQGKVSTELVELLRQLRGQGAHLVVISALPDALALAQTPLRLPADIPEWLSPLVSVVPGQLFSVGLALAKGLDPDHPRSLRKVTLTW